MDKREQVLKVIRGETAEIVPSGFFMHFKGNTVEEHLRFFEETDSCLVKVMNEGRLSDGSELSTVDEWLGYVKGFDWDRYIETEVSFASRVFSLYKGTGLTLGTIHGVAVTAHKMMKGKGLSYGYNLGRLVSYYRSSPGKTVSALRYIADNLSRLAEGFRRDGVDGSYYAAFGAEKGYFTDEEFASVIAPLDKQVLSSGGHPFLHICRPGAVIGRYESYTDMAEVFNWSVNGSGFSLEDGKRLFKGKALLGGLPNQSGPLIEGTGDEISKAVSDIVGSYGRDGLIIGADCTIPTGTELWRIRTAVEAGKVL